ncbi:MAG: hypothetical protein IPQ09_30040 [Myxococcales bacterium]|nr:hypothetical protein [Myxococcales bacterium]
MQRTPPLRPSDPRSPRATSTRAAGTAARALACVGLVAACTVPIDDTRNDKRLFPAQGVIRGTVTYVGPRPCTRDRHVVGDAIILAFDRRNPPPPLGIAASAVNFAVVPGDTLFANEPRTRGAELSCPPTGEIVSVSAPFTMSPLAGASYSLVAFYHRSGRFQPQFRYRNQPEAGDLAGGYVDQRDADLNSGNPSYVPKYLPVSVGTPGPDDTFSIPPEGALTDNVPVTIARVVSTNRPTFFPAGAELPATKTPSAGNPSGEPRYVPVVTMTQDHRVLAAPATVNLETLTRYEGSFPAVTLGYGVAPDELDVATSLSAPFGLPLEALPPAGRGGLLVFGRGAPQPESARIPALWPQVTFRKLVDDPEHKADPQSLAFQGSNKAPAVLLQGLTLLDESLVKTVAGPIGSAPSVAALRGRVKVLVRPAALCVDAARPDRGGLVVTPSLTGESADPAESAPKPVFDEGALRRGLGSLVADVRAGCLPLGRYAMIAAYPSGQVWTTPNEAGACAALEGSLVERDKVGSCNRKARPVLYSQGPRAVLEIVPPTTPEGQAACAGGVPVECLPR